MAAAPQGRRSTRSARVRWDRVSRVALLFALAVLLYLAISPVRSLMADLHLQAQKRAQLRSLQRAHAALVDDRALAAAPGDERCRGAQPRAVRPGEREYVVSGLPKN